MRWLFLVVSAFALLHAWQPPQPSTAIKVDQVGYRPDAPKIAFVAAPAAATAFTIRRAGDGGVAFSGRPATPVVDADSGDRVQALDFSSLRDGGTFYVEVPGVGRSWPFAIERGVYRQTFYLAMRSYYGQRCGTSVDLGPSSPGFAHAACHLKGAYHASSGKTGEAPSTHGWHDAGDYGRYVVNSGITTGTLLLAWELFRARVERISLDIPESRGATPDMLDEIRWNLDWMLSMQDADGGVWHKQTSERFAPFVAPEQDASVSVVIGTGTEPFKGSCATADFAAVAALAARVYRPFDGAYAERALDAARRAWTWVDAHPAIAFRNPPGIATGEYGDRDCGDERLWAAVELWRTTGDARFDTYVRAYGDSYLETIRPIGPPSWSSVGALALWSYALDPRADARTAAAIRRRSRAAADAIVDRASRHGYRTTMTNGDYVWGSNGVAANYAVQLLLADALQREPRYVAAALENLHYLLGRNTFSLSWVTQAGANPFRHPHHRPSAADGNVEPWPGLLSGGPNARRQDPAMTKLPDLPPARMYLDEQASYATNEIAINWNAPLVFVLAGALPER